MYVDKVCFLMMGLISKIDAFLVECLSVKCININYSKYDTGNVFKKIVKYKTSGSLLANSKPQTHSFALGTHNF